MASFDTYANKYETIKLERTDEGILLMTLHTNNGPLMWGGPPHREIGEAFHEIGADHDNRVVILTGTGEWFSGPRPSPDSRPPTPTERWDRTYWEGKQLLMNQLDIEVPMISAINGPCLRHSELPLLCDIVLASETASFQDSGHFQRGLMPGDGVHIIYPLLMGLNRGRYFLLTGQEIDAQEAKNLGLVAEVLPPDQLMPRAWELARYIAAKPRLLARYARVAMTLQLRKLMEDMLGYGLALEGLASAAHYENT